MNVYRYNQYYQMQNVFDSLYSKSKEDKNFYNLMDLIKSENNIKLAFRMIKSNTGSKTCGTDNQNINDIKETSLEKYVEEIQKRLDNYKPNTVRRVFIPKDNGDYRPLGIPTMMDRLIQQSIKQILEPICEAKFHPHSYGFRPNRSTKHAIARLNSLVNQGGLNYVVDVDIKGFFDNVNHNKLIKQMYGLGIRDFKLLKIIKQMLKAPIQGEGVPKKGTPQGGILSPLLSNIVLNELDWWISSQWETHPTKHKYTQLNKYNAMKKTKLKEFFIVRYADDFKIVCRSYNVARKIFYAVQEWLNKRLKLDISKEKSKIVNLRKNYSDFLGIRIKVIRRPKSKHGYVAQSRLSEKRRIKAEKTIKHKIRNLQKCQHIKYIADFNSTILGIHEYYKVATYVSLDFKIIARNVNRFIFNRLKKISKYKVPNEEEKDSAYEQFYGESKSYSWVICGRAIYPVHYIKHTSSMNFNQNINDYSKDGREKSAKSLKKNTKLIILQLSERYNPYETVEYNDNRVSRASMTGMKCEVTKIPLEIDEMHCHHQVPRKYGGTDKYDNLRILHKDVHILVHATDEEIIKKYINILAKSQNTIKRVLNNLNKLRKEAKTKIIKEDDVRMWLEVKTWKTSKAKVI